MRLTMNAFVTLQYEFDYSYLCELNGEKKQQQHNGANGGNFIQINNRLLSVAGRSTAANGEQQIRLLPLCCSLPIVAFD